MNQQSYKFLQRRLIAHISVDKQDKENYNYYKKTNTF